MQTAGIIEKVVGTGSDTGGMTGDHAPCESLPFFIAGVFGKVPDDIHGEDPFEDRGEVDGPCRDGKGVDWFAMCNLYDMMV